MKVGIQIPRMNDDDVRARKGSIISGVVRKPLLARLVPKGVSEIEDDYTTSYWAMACAVDLPI